MGCARNTTFVDGIIRSVIHDTAVVKSTDLGNTSVLAVDKDDRIMARAERRTAASFFMQRLYSRVHALRTSPIGSRSH